MNISTKQSFNIGFLLIDNFALMSFSAVVEPLRAANLIAGKCLYEISYYSVDGDSVQSSNGVKVCEIERFELSSNLDILFVVAGFGVGTFKVNSVFEQLRKLDRQGVTLGGVSGGPVILAKSGVMQNRRFTVHWEHAEMLKELMPELIIERSLYVKDRDRYTCAGGIAPLDMMNSILRLQHGTKFAQRVSDWFIHTEIRPAIGAQKSGLSAEYPKATRPMLLAIEAMRNHVSDPLDLQQIADLSKISTRQLNRLFRQKLNIKTMAFYRNIRLKIAEQFIRQSSMKVIEIAQATGFENTAHFSCTFKRYFKKSPSALRNSYTG
ncbi:MAG: transcriptional regulator GlxA family with amidase domain [Gammaproteobacteria bacterium]|jgi:transcriptional regulator GlxA family with amidase domain